MTTEVSKPLILIVDDTPTNIQVLAENLIDEYRIKVAVSGEAALEAIERQGAPDLILLDVMIPGMDGYEVCRRLKSDPQTAAIPVIFVTAMNAATNEEYGLNLGAMDYITKPFYLPVVKARIRNHIRLKQMTDMLEAMAWMDGLTGIPNRRRFDQVLENEWKRAQRNQLPLALVMVDVDYFKAYNDCHGHGAGDICLRQVATLLAASVSRSGDLVARYGGEEFVMLMPETDAEGAQRVSELLCRRVEAQQIPHTGSSASPWVTISAGFAVVVPELQQLPFELLDEADRQLYLAKESGRNGARGNYSTV
ncbi:MULTISPECIES: diguanylate cyclase domain-containing protein [Methylomonas]|uniref:diguanylate cyclase n=2 Tax=Methylomonas TaxID=416 RepID=A0A126T627_9GAMM|nr:MULTISPECIES: diguanylate cyclase [Methylomonas]AMK77522.1 diguanylate cyclase response regulator [Methylomonas denitrificans]OAI05104.1 diguanylate cyclase response regulator [Methylomonas methanica]TCV84436.1 response regulator receiver modulated diguanylate cyclase [Methylomonas methanica]